MFQVAAQKETWGSPTSRSGRSVAPDHTPGSVDGSSTGSPGHPARASPLSPTPSISCTREALRVGAFAVRQGSEHRVEESVMNWPTAELHVHIEGTIESEFLVAAARRNDVALPSLRRGRALRPLRLRRPAVLPRRALRQSHGAAHRARLPRPRLRIPQPLQQDDGKMFPSPKLLRLQVASANIRFSQQMLSNHFIDITRLSSD